MLCLPSLSWFDKNKLTVSFVQFIGTSDKQLRLKIYIKYYLIRLFLQNGDSIYVIIYRYAYT